MTQILFRITNLTASPQTLGALLLATSETVARSGDAYTLTPSTGTPRTATSSSVWNSPDGWVFDFGSGVTGAVVPASGWLDVSLSTPAAFSPGASPVVSVVTAPAGGSNPFRVETVLSGGVLAPFASASRLRILASGEQGGRRYRQLIPELISGFRAASEGQVPVRRGADIVWEAPAAGGGSATLPPGEGFFERHEGTEQATPLLVKPSLVGPTELITMRLS